jgi:mono/diheme cytochrome c family protein
MREERPMKRYIAGVVLVGCVLLWFSGAQGQTIKVPDPSLIPKDYQGKKMPDGWWTDPRIVEEGKKVYTGMANMMANCAACHGQDGKPVLPGVRDLRDAAYVAKMTDAYWFWRISEGVAGTPMSGFKGKLKEDQIWKVMAYEHTLSHGGKPTSPQH